MDINQYTKQTGEFLKAKHVTEKANELFEIIGEGKMETSEKFGNQRLHLPVKCGEEEFTFDCSKTNARTIEEALNTSDTKKWVGKHLSLETYRTKTTEGKMTEAINVKSVQ